MNIKEIWKMTQCKQIKSRSKAAHHRAGNSDKRTAETALPLQLLQKKGCKEMYKFEIWKSVLSSAAKDEISGYAQEKNIR